MKDIPLRIEIGGWAELARDAASVRQTVFVEEQGVPPELEMDDEDARCVHVVAYGPDNAPLGTGRLLPDGHIGRMAVHKVARGAGVGGAILGALIEVGRDAGHEELLLNAQTHATGFYEAQGFVAFGEPFEEAGIAHVAMRLRLA
ncbi:GNAT family N-acetyltransferase [Achromobacter aloeverae]|uniref:GNAT family N-acetyltransferase n=1 Tax=Achromobacter aloeverae TaxID=1750518 RepID=A0A4Q1HKP5_9BURK|nr:GNAT family N-acetyltransferase [Achromobacter aloeverae]RXN90991.1 GNAT family N-acetyltransferase [Achromobacter aloeverae]